MNTVLANDHTDIPDFKFYFSHRHFYKGLIKVDDEIIHCILDVDNFYNALGYTGEIRDSGLSFDEYVLREYMKDNSNKPKACLQARLIEYLIKYSSTFMKKYADQYEDWLGRCNEIARNYDECTQCAMHPEHFEHEYFACLPAEVSFYTANAI